MPLILRLGTSGGDRFRTLSPRGNWTICPLARRLDDPAENETAFPRTSNTWLSHHTENFMFHLDVETSDTLENLLVIWGLRFDLKFTARFDLPYLCLIWWTFNIWDFGPMATSDELVSELCIGKDTEKFTYCPGVSLSFKISTWFSQPLARKLRHCGVCHLLALLLVVDIYRMRQK